MPRPRKLFTALAVTAGTVTLALGLLWYKFNENISPEMWLHAENVVHPPLFWVHPLPGTYRIGQTMKTEFGDTTT